MFNYFLFVVFTLLFGLSVSAPAASDFQLENNESNQNSKLIVCYVTNWSQYRPDQGKFLPEDVDPFMCTHVVFAFAKLNQNSEISPYEWNDESTGETKGMYERTIALKELNPDLKVLIGTGGWNHGSGPFSRMVHDNKLRRNFVLSVVDFLNTHRFDGLDLDWEYPGSRADSKPADKQMYTVLIKELREAFEPFDFMLTAAVAAGKSFIDDGYEINKIGKYLDFVNLMSYDYHGSWENILGHNSPLFTRNNQNGDAAFLNVDWSVNYWIQNGMSRSKIVLGFPTYGRSFRLSSPKRNQLGAKAARSGTAGNYTREAGFLSYYEICDKLKSGWKYEWSEEHQAPYAYSQKEWVSFDDVDSFAIKAQYVQDNDLAGAMFWTLDLDDFGGNHCDQGKYPLVNAVKQVFASARNNNNKVIHEKDQDTFSRFDTFDSFKTTTTPFKQQELIFEIIQTTTTRPTTLTTERTSSTTKRTSTSPTTIPITLSTSAVNFEMSPTIFSLILDKEDNKDIFSVMSEDDKELIVKTNDESSSEDRFADILKKLKTQKEDMLKQIRSKIESKQKVFKLSRGSSTNQVKQIEQSRLPQMQPPIMRPQLQSQVKLPMQPQFQSQLQANYNNFPLLNQIPAQNQQSEVNNYMLEINPNPNKLVLPTTTPASFYTMPSVKLPLESQIQTRLDQAYRNGFTDSYQCIYDGLYADKTSGCIVFYECVWTNTRHAHKARRVCPQGTIFNQNINVCDWEFNATC